MSAAVSSAQTPDPLFEGLKNMGLGVAYIVEKQFWTENWWCILASVVFFVGMYYASCAFLQIPKEQERRRAWVMTFYSAILTVPIGVYFSAQLIMRWVNTKEWPQEFVFGHLPVARFATVFFLVYMTLDIVMGLMNYRSQLDAMSWAHHIGYGIFLMNTLKWEFSNAFAIFLIHETPTVFLSLGHINKEWRADWTFGALFFFIRIAYHSVVSYQTTVHAFQPVFCWPMAWLILALHVNWWTRWVMGMMRRSSMNLTMEVHTGELETLDMKLKSRLQHARMSLATTVQNMRHYMGFASNKPGGGAGAGGHGTVGGMGNESAYASIMNDNADPLDAQAFAEEARLIEEATQLGFGHPASYGSVGLPLIHHGHGVSTQAQRRSSAVLLGQRFASNLPGGGGDYESAGQQHMFYGSAMQQQQQAAAFQQQQPSVIGHRVGDLEGQAAVQGGDGAKGGAGASSPGRYSALPTTVAGGYGNYEEDEDLTMAGGQH